MRLGLAFALLAILNFQEAHPAEPGVQSCVIETKAGLVDISSLGNQDNTPRFEDYNQSATNYSYSWNPCYSFEESANCVGVELCQHDIVRDYNLGSDDTARFEEKDSDLFLVYTSQDFVTRTSYVQLICDEDEEGVFAVEGEEPKTVYHFSVRSKYACPKPASPTPRSLTTAAKTTQVVPSTPSPPSPNIFSLKTITILLGCILASLCLLICLVFVGLITRRSEEELPPKMKMMKF